MPGWKVKPEHWFWEQIKDGNLPQDAATLKEGWYLVDRRGKPNYQDDKQMYEDDYLAPFMENLRETGRVQKYRFVPDNSRFGASADEIEQVILPELASILGSEGIVRSKREIEFNVLGNMHYPEWGETNTWEWYADKFEDDSRLIGGHSGGGGLAHVSYDWSDNRHDGVGFAPLVEFPSEA
ncbi:MAG: hypothetical protein HY430_02440 [Candidatus Levybacteria bacterium]|nr:hypothetical protein [Candidatus Levybacteria bacterium]